MLHNYDAPHFHSNSFGRQGLNYGLHKRGQLRSFLRSLIPVRVIVDESMHAVLITDGRSERVLHTGTHRLRPRQHAVRWVSALEQLHTVPGQEILTADGGTVRITAVASISIEEPLTLVRTHDHGWIDHLHVQVQMALRDIIGRIDLEEVLERRATLEADLLTPLAAWGAERGLQIGRVAVRDLVVPGPLRAAVAEVITARLEGRAALERARGETAALRSLANAAKAVEANPALLQLRLIQHMENSDGNTYVLGSAPVLP